MRLYKCLRLASSARVTGYTAILGKWYWYVVGAYGSKRHLLRSWGAGQRERGSQAGPVAVSSRLISSSSKTDTVHPSSTAVDNASTVYLTPSAIRTRIHDSAR